MIESGFSHRAYSWAHAVGLWQFIKSTGRLYGLRSDWWVDERRDPVASTDAAARYLRALYDEFGNWELALAAYNVGEGAVRRAIKRQGTRNFWSLRLPRETRNHVPKFYAALIVGSEPEKYGFTVTPEMPYATEQIAVDFSVDLETLAGCCGVSEETLVELNPSLLRRCTPPNEDSFPVYVPAGTGEKTVLALAAIPPEKRQTPRVEFAEHRVRRGETLSKIARKYGTSVQAIVDANRLGSRNRVVVGQRLVVPDASGVSSRDAQVASSRSSRSSSASKSSSKRASAPAGTEKVVYVVKSGDTLSRIAEVHGVSTTNLRRWNDVGRHIRPGDRLTIYSKNGAQIASSSGASRSTKSSAASGPKVVRVRRGDTLWDIARTHGVSLTELLSANNMSRTARIKPGDRIKIPTN
jgi:membrane-bound lytic murein transglycosylase D